MALRMEFEAMDSIQRTRLAETVAAKLRHRLKSGEMKDSIPGVRLLSKSLGVSVPTICQAMHRLEAEGILTGGGGRRRWSFAGDQTKPDDAPEVKTQAAAVENRGGSLLYLAPKPLNRERQTGVELSANILDQMGSKGWEVMHRVVAYDTARKPRRAWDEMLDLAKPDAMIALSGTPALGKWVRRRGVRTLFVGGDPGSSGVPLLSVHVSTMLNQALDRLLALGHRRILLPLFGRGDRLVDTSRMTAERCTAGSRLTPGCVTVTETSYSSPEVVADLLRLHWQKQQVPDALILVDWHEFVTASCIFKELGVSIPEDVSVVILSHNSNMEWHMPLISHFEIPIPLMARIAAKWVVEGRPDYNPEPLVEIRARWIEGKSVLSRKKARTE